MTIYQLTWLCEAQVRDDSGQVVKQYFRTLREARTEIKRLESDSYWASGLECSVARMEVKELSKQQLLLRALNGEVVFSGATQIPSLYRRLPTLPETDEEEMEDSYEITN